MRVCVYVCMRVCVCVWVCKYQPRGENGTHVSKETYYSVKRDLLHSTSPAARTARNAKKNPA